MNNQNGRRHQKMQPPREHEKLHCPRCGSTDTKFTYYNHHKFTQPRYLCNSCRRHWTHGGTLRHIPAGGGTDKSNNRSRCSTVPTTSCSAAATGHGQPLNQGGRGFVRRNVDDMDFFVPRKRRTQTKFPRVKELALINDSMDDPTSLACASTPVPATCNNTQRVENGGSMKAAINDSMDDPTSQAPCASTPVPASCNMPEETKRRGVGNGGSTRKANDNEAENLDFPRSIKKLTVDEDKLTIGEFMQTFEKNKSVQTGIEGDLIKRDPSSKYTSSTAENGVKINPTLENIEKNMQPETARENDVDTNTTLENSGKNTQPERARENGVEINTTIENIEKNMQPEPAGENGETDLYGFKLEARIVQLERIFGKFKNAAPRKLGEGPSKT